MLRPFFSVIKHYSATCLLKTKSGLCLYFNFSFNLYGKLLPDVTYHLTFVFLSKEIKTTGQKRTVTSLNVFDFLQLEKSGWSLTLGFQAEILIQ